MRKSVNPEEGKTMDAAITDLDNQLGVSVWGLPGNIDHQVPEREEGAPDWWYGDEEASQSFLQAQGLSGRI
jgi:hypothetical protein